MFILYCRRAVVKDSSLASEITGCVLVSLRVLRKEAVLIHCCYEAELYGYCRIVFVVYLFWSMVDDYRLAGEINRVAIEVNNVVMQKDRFLEDLDSLGARHVPVKMAEFLREIQAKDKETVKKLQILEKGIELNASKKDLFIGKLKGVVPY
nr:hypothetical protein [Tanacetum cinerariifolium]